MTKIYLKTRGVFLSGRSLAQEILERDLSSSLDKSIELDFAGVDMATQSFVSELLVGLRKKGFDLSKVKISGIASETLERRVNGERERIQALGL